jgi:hypothetical protein
MPIIFCMSAWFEGIKTNQIGFYIIQLLCQLCCYFYHCDCCAVSEPEGNIPPRIEHSVPNVNARVGSPTDLVCAAQGSPPPTYRSVRSKPLYVCNMHCTIIV